jgi:hypothetical protein
VIPIDTLSGRLGEPENLINAHFGITASDLDTILCDRVYMCEFEINRVRGA